MASEGGRCGPLAESKRGRVWRRAGLEVEATPGPPLPQAQPGTPGLRGASSVPLSVAGCSRDSGTTQSARLQDTAFADRCA